MIRTGLSSSLRSICGRQLGPSSSSASSSSLLASRPFSSSPLSRQDGLFPTHPKQDIYDGSRVLKEAGVPSIDSPPSREGLVAPPSHLAELDDPTPTPATDSNLPPTTSSPENPTTDATSLAPSEIVHDLNLGSPTSGANSLGSQSFYPPPSSLVQTEPAPSNRQPADADFDFTPITPPSQPTPSLLARAQAQALLSEARRDLPSAVTEAEWKFLKGPASEMKVIRYSLLCSKNNTQGTLSWAYKPDNRSDPKNWNMPIRGTSQFSGGRLGFKGAASGGSEAGHQVVVAMFKKIEQENNLELEVRRKRNEELGLGQSGYLPETVGLHVRLNVKGFGQGREAFFKALKSEEGSLMRQLTIAISDHTPIKIVGGRPPLPRRV